MHIRHISATLVFVSFFLLCSHNVCAGYERTIVADGVTYRIIKEADDASSFGLDAVTSSISDRYSGEISIPIKISKSRDNYADSYKVVSIDDKAFLDCVSLISVYIPESIENIGKEAFNGCDNLEIISIAYGNLVNLGKWCFAGSGIKSIKLPGSVKSIGEGAFQQCENLSQIEIPSGVEYIGNMAFYGCLSLKNVDLPNSIRIIEDEAFRQSGIENMYLPNSLIKLGTGVFAESKYLNRLTLPPKINTIPDYLFYDCKALSSIVIPGNIKEIGEKAFLGCEALSTLSIPESTISIGQEAFSQSGLSKVIIPSGIKEMGKGIFRECPNLKSIGFGDSISVIPASICFGCDSLETIDFPESLTEIKAHAFCGCNLVSSLLFPPSLLIIGDYAFAGRDWNYLIMPVDMRRQYHEKTSIKRIELPRNLQVLGRCAFAMRDGLEAISIPGSLPCISQGAFANCTDLRRVKLADGLVKIEYAAFSYCKSLEDISFPKSLEEIGSDAFRYTGVHFVSTNSSLRTIGAGGFAECEGLTSVTLNQSLTSLGAGAFYGCSSLTAFDFKNAGIDEIREKTFKNCHALSSISLPHSVSIVEKNSFENSSVTSVTIYLDKEGHNPYADDSFFNIIYY